jgi:hypothetical protein
MRHARAHADAGHTTLVSSSLERLRWAWLSRHALAVFSAWAACGLVCVLASLQPMAWCNTLAAVCRRCSALQAGGSGSGIQWVTPLIARHSFVHRLPTLCDRVPRENGASSSNGCWAAMWAFPQSSNAITFWCGSGSRSLTGIQGCGTIVISYPFGSKTSLFMSVPSLKSALTAANFCPNGKQQDENRTAPHPFQRIAHCSLSDFKMRSRRVRLVALSVRGLPAGIAVS